MQTIASRRVLFGHPPPPSRSIQTKNKFHSARNKTKVLLRRLRLRLEPRRIPGLRELESRQVRQLQDLRHLLEVDLLHRVRHLVVIGVKSGEPPDRRNVAQQ